MIETYRIGVKPLLKAWGHFERDTDVLDTFELMNAKTLFHALALLPKPELDILAEKYHTGLLATTDPSTGCSRMDRPIPDEQLARRHGILTRTYRLARVKAEQQLEVLMYGDC